MSKFVRPTECCACGTYECQVPMPINGRLQSIDYCIADVVAALNASNVRTVASCCGHGQQPASIMLEDGRELTIQNAVRPWERESLGPTNVNPPLNAKLCDPHLEADAERKKDSGI